MRRRPPRSTRTDTLFPYTTLFRSFDLDPGGHIDFTAAASYIESERRLIESEDPSPFAGVIFRSPHWRARGGATFEHNNVALSAFLHYVGGVTDDRIEPDRKSVV